MPKFCPNCGNILDDQAVVCPNCGAQINASPAQYTAPQQYAPSQPYTPQQQYAPQQFVPRQQLAPQQPYVQPPVNASGGTKKSRRGLIVGIVAAALVIAVAAVILIFDPFGWLGKSGSDNSRTQNGTPGGGSTSAASPQVALNNTWEAVKKLDVDGMSESSYETNFSKEISYEKTVEEAKEQMEAMTDEQKTMYTAMMSMITLTYVSAEPVDSATLQQYKSEWSASYNDTDKIQEVDVVTYSISAMGQSEEQTCLAVKVNGKWYLKGFDAADI